MLGQIFNKLESSWTHAGAKVSPFNPTKFGLSPISPTRRDGTGKLEYWPGSPSLIGAVTDRSDNAILQQLSLRRSPCQRNRYGMLFAASIPSGKRHSSHFSPSRAGPYRLFGLCGQTPADFVVAKMWGQILYCRYKVWNNNFLYRQSKLIYARGWS